MRLFCEMLRPHRKNYGDIVLFPANLRSIPCMSELGPAEQVPVFMWFLVVASFLFIFLVDRPWRSSLSIPEGCHGTMEPFCALSEREKRENRVAEEGDRRKRRAFGEEIGRRGECSVRTQ